MIVGLLFQILTVIVLFQLVFISVFLITNRKGRRISNLLLASFFLSLTAGLTDFALLQLKVFDTYFQYAFLLNSLVIFHAPLLLLYVQSVTNTDFRLKAIHLLHSGGFLLSVGLLIPFYYTKPPEVQQYVIEGVQKGDASVFIIISIVGLLYELGYLAAVKIELNAYDKKIKERFSNIDQIHLSWLWYMVNIFIVSFIASTIASTIRHTTLDHLDEAGVILALIGFFFMINSVLLKGLHQNEIFLGLPSKSSLNKMDQSEVAELIQNLQQHLQSKKPYLNPDITINQLAEQLKVGPRDLSNAINSELGQSFFDLINRYRIEEAKKEIKQSVDPKETILEIMYRVGFNSKSSFNTAFKKYTGTTPSTYKAEISS